MIHSRFLNKKNLLYVLVTVIVVALIIVLTIVLTGNDDENVGMGAVVSNGGPCAEIGMKILKKYGNAVDTLIATMICDGLATMNNMGIGGGFVGVIYNRQMKKAYAINAREIAPAAATTDMFQGNHTLSQEGGLSVAVPGELKGYWEMYNKFGGKAPWKELFEDSIELCRTGIPINEHVADNIRQESVKIKRNPGLYGLLSNGKGELVRAGDKVINLKLADTLELVAKNGPDALYNGKLTEGFLADIRENGGIITADDLREYKPRWSDPYETSLQDGTLTLYTQPPPMSGAILAFILRVLEKSGILKNRTENVSAITEAFKFAYAQRTYFGDPNFVNFSETMDKLDNEDFIQWVSTKLDVNETSGNVTFYYGEDVPFNDHGTANMAVVAPNGDAVVATSTVNLIFGSKFVSKSTGILLNDQMDDFSSPNTVNYFGVPPSENNFIRPGAVPVSSMCPSIIVDRATGDVRLAVGAAGGTRITTATALTILRNLYFDETLNQSISNPRYHHQLTDMLWRYDPSIPKSIINDMVRRKHAIKELEFNNAAVTGIALNDGNIEASSDYRRLGNVSYLN